METNKQKKTINGLPFYSLTFLVALLFELYWILNGPSDYFMLIGIGIIIVITGYLTIDTLLKMHNDEITTTKQQNETIIKAQKAIYLASKKTAREVEQTRQQNLKTLEVLMAGMVSSQKELVSLMTSKGDTIASNQALSDSSSNMTDLIDQLSQSNEKLAKQVQDAMTIDELVKSNAELVKNVQTIFNGSTPATNTTVEEYSTIEEETLDEFSIDDELIINNESDDNVEDDLSETFDELGLDDSLLVDTLDESTIEAVTEAQDVPVTDTEADSTKDNEIEITTDINNQVTTENDERDPNAPLSEEEIAALFASL